METYVISEIDYTGNSPAIQIYYVGIVKDYAIEAFRKHFHYFKIPDYIEKEMNGVKPFADVVAYLFKELDKTGKIVIDDEWGQVDDKPYYLQVIKKSFK